jgi:short-subunit dehydrogenase
MNFTGTTALITGASSGIGLAYAQEFAKRGANLVLVARRKPELEALATELRSKSGADVTVFAADLSVPGAAASLVTAVAKQKITVDVLVNNAGFGTNNRLIDEDRERIQAEITLNVSTLTDLTAAYLPGMIDRNRGTIINIASTAAFQPVPGMAVYAATKAFVLSFTQAVWGELGDSAVRVLAVCPGATDTAFFDVAGKAPSTPLAPIAGVIDATFRALAGRKQHVVVGGRNRVMAFSTRLVPTSMVTKVAGSMFLPEASR